MLAFDKATSRCYYPDVYWNTWDIRYLECLKDISLIKFQRLDRLSRHPLLSRFRMSERCSIDTVQRFFRLNKKRNANSFK